jgi:hypothetical protein
MNSTGGCILGIKKYPKQTKMWEDMFD